MPTAAAQRLIEHLLDRGFTVATCESLTAGMVSATLAEVPGASGALRGGLVTYATELKASLAGVSQATLDQWGPVAQATALEMAQGARERLSADWAVALTGVAGPTPQDGHPVGEVWVAIAGPKAATATQLQLSGTRQEIRVRATREALELLDAAVVQDGAPCGDELGGDVAKRHGAGGLDEDV